MKIKNFEILKKEIERKLNSDEFLGYIWFTKISSDLIKYNFRKNEAQRKNLKCISVASFASDTANKYCEINNLEKTLTHYFNI